MGSFDVVQEQAAVAAKGAGSGPAARFGRSLAVVIGIDTYGEGISPLRSAVADARAIADALERDHGFETRRLLEEDARLPRLLTLLREELPAALRPCDRLLIYFAGHGIALDGDAGPAGYLVPAGARRGDHAGYLPMNVLHDELSRLPVRHALLVLDCCFAGAFRWTSLRDVELVAGQLCRERYDRYVASPAWQVLTSASHDQLAIDALADTRRAADGEHSPFARALLAALAGAADYTGDHVITADELMMYAREHTAPVAEAVGRHQVPQIFPLERHGGGQFVFHTPGRVVDLAPAPPLDERANPFHGLERHREEVRALFFGRSAMAAQLADAIAARRLTAVVGPSGSGKSTLVHAGVVPALRGRGWTVLSQRPGAAPLAALGALARELGGAEAGGDPAAAWLAAVDARARRQPGAPWLVIIDQLEELAGPCTVERDREAFLEALAAALRAAPSLRIAVTVRSDAEPVFHGTALGPWWAAGRFSVPAMSRDELRQIIEQPAAAAVLCFEPARLIEQLLDDVAQTPEPLPLLALALSELYRRCWERWQAGERDRALRAADYEAMGGIEGALILRATALHDELAGKDAAYAATIRNLFVRMVAVSDGERAPRRVNLDELAYGDAAENCRVAEVLQQFHEARLISVGRPEGGAASSYAEPMHAELVRGWPLVTRWLTELDTPAGTHALLGALEAAARAWHEGGRATSLLWTDRRVEEALAFGRRRPFAFAARAAQFLRSSARLRFRQRAGFLGVVFAAVAVLLVVCGVALWQRGIAAQHAARADRIERVWAAEQEAHRASAEAAQVERELERMAAVALERERERTRLAELAAMAEEAELERFARDALARAVAARG